MSTVTLEGIAALLQQEFEHHLDPIKKDVAAMKETLDSHTATLDAIAKNTQNWEVEKAALTGRMNRHEEVIKRLAIKVGLKLDWPEPLHQ
jgi:hypothetical protein